MISAKTLFEKTENEVSKLVVGKSAQLKLITSAILADGHILLEDVPGVGKTTLVKAISKALGCDTKRIQFTPDLLPSDVIGTNIFDRKTGEFKRLVGPVMTNILLADELNRAIPRTQSALLEAMEEKQISIDGVCEKLPNPFIVLATQNPVESESTFKLPAAQLDRFLICISMGYPTVAEELEMLKLVGNSIDYDQIQSVSSAGDIEEIKLECNSVFISDEVQNYIISITNATRENPNIRLGASPRATRALYRIARCYAAISGRNYVIPDDVKELAKVVLGHRLVLNSEAVMVGKTASSIIDEIIASIPVPPLKENMFNE